MTSELSTSRIYTDFQGLSDLRRAAKEDSEQALEEVAAQFEAIFIQMMLKSMRDASLSDGIFDSEQSEMYMGMFDQQIALDMSSKGAFGIADMLVQQLANNKAGETTSATMRPLSLTGTAEQRTLNNVDKANSQEARPQFNSPQAFIDFMYPQAEQAASKLGVKPQVLIAQAALETGWGEKIIKQADGTSSYNLFGVKADQRWSGKEATVSTLEYRDGVVNQELASFRAYDSYQQSFDDYVDFVKQGQRYQQALGHGGNARHYIQALQEAGYATDPNYAEKVLHIMERDFG
jgi:peptidoglycan hydrolase FlgJ